MYPSLKLSSNVNLQKWKKTVTQVLDIKHSKPLVAVSVRLI